MRIASVEYRRVKHLSKVESEVLGATAEVGRSETPEQAFGDLQAWVDAQIGDAEEAQALRSSIRELTWKKEGLERQVEMVERRWSAIREFLLKLGLAGPIEIPELPESLSDGR